MGRVWIVLPGTQSSEEDSPRLFGQFSEEGPCGLALPPPKVSKTRRWEEAAGCAFLLLVLRTPQEGSSPPREQLIPRGWSPCSLLRKLSQLSALERKEQHRAPVGQGGGRPPCVRALLLSGSRAAVLPASRPRSLPRSSSLRAVLAPRLPPSPQGTLPPRRARDRGGPRVSLWVSVPGALGAGELTTQPSARVRAGPPLSALGICLSWVLPACV